MRALAVSQSLLDQPGTVAFLVVFGMAVACVFLFKSMSKHLRRVNDAARAEAEAAARDADGGSARPDGGRASAGAAQFDGAQPVVGDDGTAARRRS